MAEKGKISFLPVTNVLIAGKTRWVDLYALIDSEGSLRDEEIAEVKESIESGTEAIKILNHMKIYYEQETERTSGEER